MNSIQKVSRFNFKRVSCSYLHMRCYHPLHFRSFDTKYSICRASSRTVISSRNFSLPQFYISLSQSAPVQSFQNFLLDLHQSTGLPWWGLIMLTTLGIRTAIVFPLAVHQNQVIARLSNINDEIGKLVPELNKEVNIAKVMYKWDETHAKKIFKRQLRQIHNKFVIRDNCHPFKTVLLSLFQVPLWIVFSISLRNLTFMSQSSNSVTDSLIALKNEGLLWFPDLTCPDMFVIPILLLFVNLTLTEVHALRSIGKGSKLQKFLINTSRGIIVIVAVAATINPSSVTFYWLCSSTFGLGQNLLLMVPKVRRIFRIPKTSKESDTPFSDIAVNFKKRFSK
ncbi:cytochrome c oxidase assembly protein COX18, mitochondrial-like [Argiope bruennichi]|uniref:cytochrome c oxidase assembly protein COX18, mitochondrial-like n=1 Tax=Argiope bruennichi TaxID=94029 RepID=UPI002493F74C|nr:cytochrome c oxidase assembly protein COX18, mitochondrial-like [Argiope bruennichi]